MMLILPLSHERMEARRFPIVTTSTLLVCAAVLVWQMRREPQAEEQLAELTKEAAELLARHPRLSVPDSLVRLGLRQPEDRGKSSEARRKPNPLVELGLVDAAGATETRAEEADAGLAQAQVELEAVALNIEAVVNELPSMQYGYRRDGRPLGLVTYNFLHGGVVHFLSNAWFLWLCGCNVEDRWGRWLYLPFYLSAGMLAAVVHGFFTSEPWVPLVGASGAIAGAMGAFLVLFARTQIRFFYFYWLLLRPRSGTFWASALVMLPLWLAVEVLWGVLDTGDGTAHFAHVGGFAFGVLVALALRLTGADRWLDSAADLAATHRQDPEILRAAELGAARRYDEAFRLLDRAAASGKNGIDVELESLRLAQESGQREREVRAFSRLVSLYLEQGMNEPAAGLTNEIRQRGLEPEIARDVRFGWAESLARRGLRADAARLYEQIARPSLDDELAVRAAVGFATLASSLGRTREGHDWLEAARRSPHLTADLAQRVVTRLSRPPPS